MNERKIGCEEVIAHIFDYLDGELDAARQAQFDRHLAECRGCYSRAEFEKALKRKVAELGEGKAPEALRRRLKLLLDEF